MEFYFLLFLGAISSKILDYGVYDSLEILQGSFAGFLIVSIYISDTSAVTVNLL